MGINIHLSISNWRNAHYLPKMKTASRQIYSNLKAAEPQNICSKKVYKSGKGASHRNMTINRWLYFGAPHLLGALIHMLTTTNINGALHLKMPAPFYSYKTLLNKTNIDDTNLLPPWYPYGWLYIFYDTKERFSVYSTLVPVIPLFYRSITIVLFNWNIIQI